MTVMRARSLNGPTPDSRTGASPADAYSAFIPPPIARVEDTGLSYLWLQDLALKTLYFKGYPSGFQIAEDLALPFQGVVDGLLETLKREKLVEIKSSQAMGLGEGAYIYAITGLGIARAREALERSQYAGPAPVPLEDYCESVRLQSRDRASIRMSDLEAALADLVIPDRLMQRIGPAVNSGASLFLFGPPGNGKTSIARAIGSLLFDSSLYIPYSIYVDGQVIKLYDSVNHQRAADDLAAPSGTGSLRAGTRRDLRWVKVRRPFIMVGGELTLEGLDLVYDDVHKFYEAPFQVKANGGMLLIDDFGRQQVRPRDLLNRWIVPLENRIDYLSLHTGRKIEVPFDVLVTFSTNLPPRDLVDEAFLRRLRHKIEVGDPGYEEYRQIFQRVARLKGVAYNDQTLAYLLQEWYVRRGRRLRAAHPRDLCDHILDIAAFTGIQPAMTKELIDRAAESYFVELAE